MSTTTSASKPQFSSGDVGMVEVGKGTWWPLTVLCRDPKSLKMIVEMIGLDGVRRVPRDSIRELYVASVVPPMPFSMKEKWVVAMREAKELEMKSQPAKEALPVEDPARGQVQFTQFGVEKGLLLCGTCKSTVYTKDITDHVCGPARAEPTRKRALMKPTATDALSRYVGGTVLMPFNVKTRKGRAASVQLYQGEILSMQRTGKNTLDMQVLYEDGEETIHTLTTKQLNTLDITLSH